MTENKHDDLNNINQVDLIDIIDHSPLNTHMRTPHSLIHVQSRIHIFTNAQGIITKFTIF